MIIDGKKYSNAIETLDIGDVHYELYCDEFSAILLKDGVYMCRTFNSICETLSNMEE